MPAFNPVIPGPHRRPPTPDNHVYITYIYRGPASRAPARTDVSSPPPNFSGQGIPPREGTRRRARACGRSLWKSDRRADVELSGYTLRDGLEYEEQSGPSGEETWETRAERSRTRGDAYAPNKGLVRLSAPHLRSMHEWFTIKWSRSHPRSVASLS